MKYNTKNYDYLIVGSGPYGSIFAYEAAKRGNRSHIIEKHAHMVGIITNTRKMALMSMTTAHISSTRITKKSGTMSINSRSLMVTLIKLLPITKENSIICLSI